MTRAALQVERLADALLWEGYLLYPYRATALKNRHRWQFGIVSPRVAASSGDADDWFMETECLIEPVGDPVLTPKIRHLQLQRRELERAVGQDTWEGIPELVVGRSRHRPWDEGLPHTWTLPPVCLSAMDGQRTYDITVPAGREVEPVDEVGTASAARWIRTRRALSVTVIVTWRRMGDLLKVRIRIENRTDMYAEMSEPEAVLTWSLISTHTLLTITDGAFVSPLEVPIGSADLVCRQHRTWPVLVGTAPDRTMILSSPIILSDYPAVAPESPVDLYDSTEIDEILTLRVLTLTAEERREALATDPRARSVLGSADGWSAAKQVRLHGAVRGGGDTPSGARPESETHANMQSKMQSKMEEWLNPSGPAETSLSFEGAPLVVGAAVRLRPSGSADAMDMFLRGQTAKVAGIYRDLEDHAHVAVTVDAEGADDLHQAEGRFFYFRPDELEVVSPSQPTTTPAPRVLVAGIGNIFFGDDGFGSAVVDRLARETLPHDVSIEDYGIRGVHLAHDILEANYEVVILVDAVARGDAPGTLFVIEPEAADEATPQAHEADAHAMTPEAVLAYVRRLGAEPRRVLVVGCEPASVEPEMGLSEPVGNAVEGAVALVHDLLVSSRS